MVDPSTIRLRFSSILRSHHIDDLALEMELVGAARELFGDVPKAPKGADEVRQRTEQAIQTGGLEIEIREHILYIVQSQLELAPYGKDAQDFMDMAYRRWKHGERIEHFAFWWRTEYPDKHYWSFKAMIQKWPQAFTQEREVEQQPKDKLKGKKLYVPKS